MRFRTRIAAISAAVALAVTGLTLTASPAATAASTAPATHEPGSGLVYIGKILPPGDPNQICIITPYNSCMNAWSGGPLVKDYSCCTSNDAFVLLRDTTRCNNGYSTANCPIAGIPAGFEIVVVQYQGGGTYNNDYVGDNNNDQFDAKAGLVGYGGWGWDQILSYGVCTNNNWQLTNVHWTTNWSNRAGVYWVYTSNGNQAYLNDHTLLCLNNSTF